MAISATPQIEVARAAGACFGVDRALKLVEEAAASSNDVHTLGPLIHNQRVVDELATLGVTAVAAPEEAAGETLVLRTHGVSPSTEAAARAHCTHVIDATCPYVKRVHRTVERLAAEGYQVLIVGEKGHPEVEGSLGHAPDALVIADPAELDQATLKPRIGVVAQTTMASAVLRGILDALMADRHVSELRVHNTICDATTERQDAAVRLACRASVMLVLGGRTSANTRHLADLCTERCPATHHIESPAELAPEWFANAQLIGITAGASTPTSHIDEIVSSLEQLLA